MTKDAGYGFTGKILQVDLTQTKISTTPTPIKLARQYVGGSGLAARILYSLLTRDLDPLSADNPLFLLAGPLTGTVVPLCGRLTICTKSPLTQFWGESNIGGDFGARLRQAGYDGVFITGRAKHPTLLTILNDQIELQKNPDLWTRRVNETIDQLHKDFNEKRMATLTIGPAGENQVKFANIMSEGGRTAGRMGLGAVMGSKYLKAIVAVGDSSVPVAKPDELIDVTRSATKVLMEDFQIDLYKELGTAAFVGASQETGSMPNAYWTKGEFPTYDNISGSTMLEKILVGTSGCYRCPVRCGRVVEIPKGKYKLPSTSGPEYETIASLGSMILCDDLEALVYASHLCDDLGVDTISCGTTIGFAYYLMEQGKLSKKEVGMELKWGDPEPQHQLIKQIAAREGFGNILAEGSRALGNRYNASEDAANVKGLELACWGVRALFGCAVAYATSPRGGCHLDADTYWVLHGQVIPEIGVDADDPQTDEGMGEMTALLQNWRMVTNSLIICIFATYQPDEVAQFYSLVTGLSTSTQDLMHMGERIITLKRLINLNLGFTPNDDTLPSLVLRPLEGPTRGMVPNLDRQLSDYYRFRDWDRKTGYPSQSKIKELGLENLTS